MRMRVGLLFWCFVAIATAAFAQPTFPYKTTVAATDVYVRSGPGQSYYPTDKLRRGQEVEVYRHDPGGWCAIRPVEGSFTWVSSRFLKPTEDHLAVVTDEGVWARVGSQFSDMRDVKQVRLHKGEVVEILEIPPPGAGRSAWCKISPPAGEFRWVSAKYLDAEYPREGLRVAPAVRKHRPRPEDPLAESVPNDGSPPRIPAEALAEDHSADASLRAKSAQPRSLAPEEFQAELERIELELSVMVIEAPSEWSFDALRERTNMLVDQAQTAVERGRARLLANRIARFDDIKQRQDAVLAMRTRTDHESQLLSGVRPEPSRGERSPEQEEIDGRFDGVGRLTQVVAPKPGAPRYALTDDSGSVRTYVTPAPGVSLQNYIGRRVGVNGSRGYVPEQRSSHIMARHVTSLEGSMLR
jgi:uncharacterized protein YraI